MTDNTLLPLDLKLLSVYSFEDRVFTVAELNEMHGGLLTEIDLDKSLIIPLRDTGRSVRRRYTRAKNVPKTMLERMKAESIFGVDSHGSTTHVEFSERCDGAYVFTVSKAELGQLIQELTTIHDSLDEVSP